MLREHEIEVRVRYNETDPGGYVHHGQYFTWFEMGRTELLRASGCTYRDMESDGRFVVVVQAQCRYHRPACYDDVLRLHTLVKKVRAATIEHEYKLYRGTELLTEATILLCCVDREGRPERLPDYMQPD